MISTRRSVTGDIRIACALLCSAFIYVHVLFSDAQFQLLIQRIRPSSPGYKSCRIPIFHFIYFDAYVRKRDNHANTN